MSVFFRFSPLLRENVSVAIKSIIGNRLRSILTIIIIAIGITSLIGILTAIDSLTKEIYSSFEQMGAHSISISRLYYSTSSADRERVKNKREISYYQAKKFKDEFEEQIRTHYRGQAIVSINTMVSYDVAVKYGAESTNPNMLLVAADENYLDYGMLSIEQGRNFTTNDIESGAFVCIIGGNIAQRLFGTESPIEKVVTLSGVRFKVIGVLQSVGATAEGGSDNSIIVPIQCARGYFIGESSSFEIGVKPVGGTSSGGEIAELAEQIFRSVRRLAPSDGNDFRIRGNEALLSELSEVTATITIIGIAIGLITLLGAAVGLMNIMLISVKERIAEIGTRRAIGASAKMIKQQFLLESVMISEVGCVAGIVLGLIAGNIVALIMGSPFVIPYMKILYAVLLCVVVGVLSGYIPAVRASKLDPIESLRYE